MTTTDARTAYINVLSHAGASHYRDAVDRRIVRGVLNQFGSIIDSPPELYNGNTDDYPSLPTGTKPTDSNSDGVADWYAAVHGYGVAPTAPKINNVVTAVRLHDVGELPAYAHA